MGLCPLVRVLPSRIVLGTKELFFSASITILKVPSVIIAISVWGLSHMISCDVFEKPTAID